MANFLIYLIILIPALGMLSTLILKQNAARRIMIFLFMGGTLAAVVLLGRIIVLWGEVYTNSENVLIEVEWIVKLLNLGFCIAFTVIGMNLKKFSVSLIALFELFMLILMETEVFGRITVRSVFSVGLYNIIFLIAGLLFITVSMFVITRKKYVRTDASGEKSLQNIDSEPDSSLFEDDLKTGDIIPDISADMAIDTEPKAADGGTTIAAKADFEREMVLKTDTDAKTKEAGIQKGAETGISGMSAATEDIAPDVRPEAADTETKEAEIKTEVMQDSAHDRGTRAEDKKLEQKREIVLPMLFLLTAAFCAILLIDNVVWLFCFLQMTVLAVFYIRKSSADSKREADFVKRMFRVRMLGNAVFITAAVLLFMCIQQVSLTAVGEGRQTQSLSLAIGLFVLAVFINTGLFPLISGDSDGGDDKEEWKTILKMIVLMISSMPALFLFYRITVFFSHPIQSRAAAATGVVLFLGFSVLSIVTGGIRKSGYYSLLGQVSMLFCVIALRKGLLFWNMILLLASVIISVFLFHFFNDNGKEVSRRLQTGRTMKGIFGIILCIFVNTYVMKLFASSPFFYIFVIPGCVFNILHMINFVAIGFEAKMPGTGYYVTENRECPATFVGLDVFAKYNNEKVYLYAMNILAFAFIAIMLGIFV